jgi:hypothetical protein
MLELVREKRWLDPEGDEEAMSRAELHSMRDTLSALTSGVEQLLGSQKETG